jgi:hypothetical protein
VVAFDAAGRPQLRRLLCRHALLDGWRIEQAAQWCPVTYVVFDLLWLRGRSLLRQPLKQRREALAELCATNPILGVVFSAGVTGAGRAFYAAAVAAVRRAPWPSTWRRRTIRGDDRRPGARSSRRGPEKTPESVVVCSHLPTHGQAPVKSLGKIAERTPCPKP